jgi:hypothetical protein
MSIQKTVAYYKSYFKPIIIHTLKYPNIMMPFALPITSITYIYDLHILKKWKNKLDKLSFLKIYNGRECIVIFKITLHKK